jgi:hypothetical protein
MNNADLYKTKDQFIASTLYSLGVKLASSEWRDGKCFLYFKNQDKCDQIVSAYYSGELTVNPRTLFDSFKTIKAIIFD